MFVCVHHIIVISLREVGMQTWFSSFVLLIPEHLTMNFGSVKKTILPYYSSRCLNLDKSQFKLLDFFMGTSSPGSTNV